jgi:hypothetical protein
LRRNCDNFSRNWATVPNDLINLAIALIEGVGGHRAGNAAAQRAGWSSVVNEV